MSFTYYYVDRESSDLLIYFNSLAATGSADNFLLKNTLPENFKNFNILILKDCEGCNWYLTIIDEIKEFLPQLSEKKSIKNIFALADSSGAIPLLNCLPNNPFFRKGVIVNGQVDISEDVIYKYRDGVVGEFKPEKVKGKFDKKYLKPLDLINYSNSFEILFYFNYFRSDKIYADIISNLSKSNFKLKLDFKRYEKYPCHTNYITDLFTDKKFFEEINLYYANH